MSVPLSSSTSSSASGGASGATSEQAPPAAPEAARTPTRFSAAHRVRQALAVAVVTGRRRIFSLRSVFLWLAALLPLLLFTGRALYLRAVEQQATTGEVTGELAEVFANLFVTLIVFFGCVAVFGNLVRREMLEKTLHYYFLSPLRRDVLLAGKYLGGVATATAIFWIGAVAAFVVAYLPTGSLGSFLFDGPGLGHLATYLAILLLAVVAYGALFLTLGIFFKKPAIAAIVFFGWEAANFLLPPLLKRFSVIHYLKALLPVPVGDGPIALLSDPPPAWVAVLTLLVLSALLLLVAGWKLGRMEILYGED